MTYTFNASAAGLAAWVTLSGPDAQDFLHRLTTVHVRDLRVGQGAPGFFLTAQGKIRSYFTLWNFGPSDYAFELDPGQGGKWKTELLAAIDQYTFAEKITVTDVASALECRWILDDPAGSGDLLARLGAPALEPGQTVAVDEEIRLAHHGARDFGRTWVSAWGRPARLQQWLERALPDARAASLGELESWRVGALRPRVDAEITAATIPLEAGLTEAIAQGKGCYPGQEVIERIAALGSPARRLARIEGSGPAPRPGDKLFNLAEPPAEVGELTTVVESGEGFAALGFVRKIHAKEGLEVRLQGSTASGRITQIASFS
jgi:folate-binding protein YgfZ